MIGYYNLISKENLKKANEGSKKVGCEDVWIYALENNLAFELNVNREIDIQLEYLNMSERELIHCLCDIIKNQNKEIINLKSRD